MGCAYHDHPGGLCLGRSPPVLGPGGPKEGFQVPWWGRLECSTWNMAQGRDLPYALPGPSNLVLGECSTWNIAMPRNSGIRVGDHHPGGSKGSS